MDVEDHRLTVALCSNKLEAQYNRMKMIYVVMTRGYVYVLYVYVQYAVLPVAVLRCRCTLHTEI